MLFLLQDGITNGAIYALLGLALVLVFAVTRVILIPQGEFVTYGALSYADAGDRARCPAPRGLRSRWALVAFALDLFFAREALHAGKVVRSVALNIVFPVALLGLTYALVGPQRRRSRSTSRCRC